MKSRGIGHTSKAKQRQSHGLAWTISLVGALAIASPSLANPAPADPVADLLHPQESVRRRALEQLQQSDDAVATLMAALKQPSWQQRVIAAYHLGQLGAADAVSPLEVALQDNHPDVRFSAAQALGQIGSAAASPALLTALEDSEETVRTAATEALLKQINGLDQEQLKQLGQVLIDNSNNAWGISANLKFRNKTPLSAPEIEAARQERAVGNLVYALGHRNWLIRQTAAEELRRLITTDDRAVRQLLPTVRWQQQGYIRTVVAELLASLDRQRLVGLARSVNDELALIYLLGESGSNEAVPELVPYLSASEYHYVKEAADALGRISTPEALAALVQRADQHLAWPGAIAGRSHEVLTQEFYRRLTSRDRTVRQEVLRLASFGLDIFPNIADAFRQIPTEQALDKLIPELTSGVSADSGYDYPRFRAGAISLLELLPPENVVATVRDRLDPVDSFAVFYEMRAFEQELVVGNRAMVLTTVAAAQQLLAQLQRDNTPSLKHDLWQMVSLLHFLAESGSPKAKDGLTDLMGNGEAMLEALGLWSTLNFLKDIDISPEMEAALVEQFWQEWEFDETEKTASNITVQLKIMERLNDYTLARKLMPAMAQYHPDFHTMGDQETLRQTLIEQIHNSAIRAYLGLEPYSERTHLDIDTHQLEGLSIDITRYRPLIVEALDRQEETYSEFDGLSHVRAIQLLLLDEQHVDQAVTTALNLLRRNSWRSWEDGTDIVYAVDNLLQVLDQASDYSEEYEAVLSQALAMPYGENPALQTALQNQQANYRRTIAFAIGQQETVPERDIDALQNTLNNPREHLQVRWMAAAVLQRLGYNTRSFFLTHQLSNPELLRADLCGHDTLSVGIDYSPDPIPTNEELLYLGRCSYGYIEQGGGDWPGIYRQIKELLSRARNRDSE